MIFVIIGATFKKNRIKILNLIFWRFQSYDTSNPELSNTVHLSHFIKIGPLESRLNESHTDTNKSPKTYIIKSSYLESDIFVNKST